MGLMEKRRKRSRRRRLTPDAIPEQSGLGGRKPGNPGNADNRVGEGGWKENVHREEIEAETSSGIACCPELPSWSDVRT